MVIDNILDYYYEYCKFPFLTSFCDKFEPRFSFQLWNLILGVFKSIQMVLLLSDAFRKLSTIFYL